MAMGVIDDVEIGQPSDTVRAVFRTMWARAVAEAT